MFRNLFRRSRSRRREKGLASIELIAMAPLLFTVALVITQIGIAGWTMVSAGDAARHAARAASMGEDPYSAAEGSLPSGLHPERVEGSPSLGTVSYTVTVRVPSISIIDVGTVSRTAVMPQTT